MEDLQSAVDCMERWYSPLNAVFSSWLWGSLSEAGEREYGLNSESSEAGLSAGAVPRYISEPVTQVLHTLWYKQGFDS